MSKMINRLHLREFGVEKGHYEHVLGKMEGMSLGDAKSFFSVYQELSDRIEEAFKEREVDVVDLEDAYEEEYKDYWEHPQVEGFLSERIRVDLNDYLIGYEPYVDTAWSELNGLTDTEMVEVDIQLHSLKGLLDLHLLERDDYWHPRYAYTLYMWEKVKGRSLKKEKERIWQPKS